MHFSVLTYALRHVLSDGKRIFYKFSIISARKMRFKFGVCNGLVSHLFDKAKMLRHVEWQYALLCYRATSVTIFYWHRCEIIETEVYRWQPAMHEDYGQTEGDSKILMIVGFGLLLLTTDS